MSKTEKKFAVGYCRVSTDEQRKESIDHQQREIQKYADENGIEIIECTKTTAIQEQQIKDLLWSV